MIKLLIKRFLDKYVIGTKETGKSHRHNIENYLHPVIQHSLMGNHMKHMLGSQTFL